MPDYIRAQIYPLQAQILSYETVVPLDKACTKTEEQEQRKYDKKTQVILLRKEMNRLSSSSVLHNTQREICEDIPDPK